MKPIQICQHLGQGHIDAYYDELSGKEVRVVLKAGGCSVNVPETAYTQAARRRAWRKRFDAEFNGGNDQLALALLLLGAALWRLDYSLLAFNPGNGYHYFPSAEEVLISLGFVAIEVCAYLLLIRLLPVLPSLERVHQDYQARGKANV